MKIEEIKKEEIPAKNKIKRFVCHSPCGFLMDLLEGHGFAVRSIESYGHSRKEFRIDVEIAVDNKMFEEMLKERLEKIITRY